MRLRGRSGSPIVGCVRGGSQYIGRRELAFLPDFWQKIEIELGRRCASGTLPKGGSKPYLLSPFFLETDPAAHRARRGVALVNFACLAKHPFRLFHREPLALHVNPFRLEGSYIQPAPFCSDSWAPMLCEGRHEALETEDLCRPKFALRKTGS